MAADERVFLVAVFVVALALRLLYVSRVMSDAELPGRRRGRPRLRRAGVVDRQRATGSRSRSRIVFRCCCWGMSGSLAAIYSVAGHSYFALTAVQSVLGAAAVRSALRLARRDVRPHRRRRVAAIFAAVSFPLVFAAATIGHQARRCVPDRVDRVAADALIDRPAARAWRWAGGRRGGRVRVHGPGDQHFLRGLSRAVDRACASAADGGVRAPRLVAFSAGADRCRAAVRRAEGMVTADARQAMRAHFDRMYRGEGGSRADTADRA